MTPGVHKAVRSVDDEHHCGVCGQRIRPVPSGQGMTLVHSDSGAVAAPNPPSVNLVWESSGTDEPGDQFAVSRRLPNSDYAIGPNHDGTWNLTLVERDDAMTVTAETTLGDYNSEVIVKHAAQQYDIDNRLIN